MEKDVKKPLKDGSKTSSQNKKQEVDSGKKFKKHQDLGEDLTLHEEEEALKKPAPNEEL